MYHLSLQVVLLRMIYSTSTAIANAFALFWGPLILLWMAYWAERSQLQRTAFSGLWVVFFVFFFFNKDCLINTLYITYKSFLGKISWSPINIPIPWSHSEKGHPYERDSENWPPLHKTVAVYSDTIMSGRLWFLIWNVSIN